MKILGIDPGYSLLGFGIVEDKEGTIKLIDAGVVDTSNINDFNQKILYIHTSISQILEKHSPEYTCIEELFFYKNITTGIKVAQIIGVVKLEIIKHNIPIVEITPLEVKKYLTGTRGKHPKAQIQNLVKILLGLNKTPKPDDCADAIAIAIAGLSKIKFRRF